MVTHRAGVYQQPWFLGLIKVIWHFMRFVNSSSPIFIFFRYKLPSILTDNST